MLIFKLLHGYLDVDDTFIPSLSHNVSTRGHSLKLATQRAAKIVGSNFVVCRRTALWNSLPENVFASSRVANFCQSLQACGSDIANSYSINARFPDFSTRPH